MFVLLLLFFFCFSIHFSFYIIFISNFPCLLSTKGKKTMLDKSLVGEVYRDMERRLREIRFSSFLDQRLMLD